MERVKVLRIVPIASRSGAYGGPYSTAVRQTEIGLTSDVPVTLLSGFLRGDGPTSASSSDNFVFVKVRPVLPHFGFRVAFSFAFATTALRLIRENQVIHITFAREVIPLYATFVALLFRKTVVLQSHGMIEQKPGCVDWFDELVTRKLVRRASNTIVLTEREERIISEWVKTNIRTAVLGNSVPDELVQRSVDAPLSNARWHSPEVLSMGRLHPRKRVCDFVEAAAITRSSRRRADWVVVGPNDGDLESLLKQSDRLGQPVRFQDAVPPGEAIDRLARTDIFVLSAINEPWGNLLVAALALGRVVVVNESAALAPLIERANAGIVVRSESGEEIAQAVCRALDDYHFAKSMGNNARHLAAAVFSDARLAGTLLNIWGAQ